MTKFYSKSTNGFYTPDIHDPMPSDVIEISEELWVSLIESHADGKIIQPDANGNPISILPTPSESDIAKITAKTSAVAKLTALGLTADEISALGV
jgi:DNA-binding NarL/FixJ family response regulator